MNNKNELFKKETREKKSHFWNTTTIDREKFSEKGGNKSGTKPPIKQSIFSKLIKKLNSVLSAGQKRSENKVKPEQNPQSIGQIQIAKPNRHTSFHSNATDGILPSLPFSLNSLLDDPIEPSDWETTLMGELDATQYAISNKSLTYHPGYNSDSNELVINALQPSCNQNRKPSHHNVAAMEEKLGAISKKTMIHDWLHYNSIPNSATTDMPITSYLQHYQYSNQDMFSKKELSHHSESASVLSAQLKKQGKQKHDPIKEKLDRAAARRNEIKTNRRREQMDTALFETMHLIRRNNHPNLLEQDLNQLFYDNAEKKGTRKIYVSDATSSSSLSNHHSYFSIDHDTFI